MMVPGFAKLILGAGAALAISVPSGSAAPRPFHVLQNFPNYGSPLELIVDKTGAVFGTTYGGGKHGRGTVYKLSRDSTEKVLYDFKDRSGPAYPTARLLRDQAGDLFGIASRIGSDSYGTAVFKISHGKETTLHFFGEGQSALGAPHGGVIADGVGNLYGVTCGGGAHDAGQVFKITPAGDTSILHEFAGSDGLCPAGELLADGQGNFYGTTFQGGDSNDGVVFKLASDGTETIIHSFVGTDGCHLWGGLIRDDAGNLYGTASYCGSGSGGTVYRISPNGKTRVLHAFNSSDSDGNDPVGTLVRDTKGNLYGMTADGGDGFPNTDGTVFRISAGGRATILHSFSGDLDGGFPIGGLAMDDAGNLYGSTAQGGAFGSGTVFEIGK